MKRNHLTTGLFLLPMALFFLSCSQNIKIQPFEKEVEQYGHLFITFHTSENFDNPYNQEEIKVDGKFQCPSGKTLYVPCFFNEIKNGQSEWQLRFTPREAGPYQFQIILKKGDKEIISKKASFISVKSNKKGLLSVDSTDYYFLRFDNGQKYRGLGLNVGWEFEPKWGSQPMYTYQMYYDEMVKNNANCIRTWICPWNMPIEWTPVPYYNTLVDEFTGFNNMLRHSNSLKINAGPTPVTQNDTGQLLLSSQETHFLVYKTDSAQKTKMMIYYRGALSEKDIEIFYSPDDITYTKINTVFSERWDLPGGWKRIFLFSDGKIPQPANYLKYVIHSSVKPENIKIAGIHINYGNPLGILDCGGLSKFSKSNSEKLDRLISLSENMGIYILLTLGYHGQFNPLMDAWGANDEWQRNPYNVKNGGPCQKPADFFSDSVAKKHYKNYLRYFIARWGYSQAVLAWEFWNEIDIAMRSQQVPEKEIVNWHREMADYLKETDPYQHLVTTSLSWGDIPGLWQIPSIDLTQIHRYEPSARFAEKSIEMVEKFKKPHVLGEYAVGWKGPGNDYPASGYEGEFHDGMWRGMFSPVGILPLSWWWDYHFENHHYFHFKTLGETLKKMEETANSFQLHKIKPVPNFEIRALQSPELTIAWIKKMSAANTLQFTLPVLQDKEYQMTVIDTWSNEKIKETKITASKGAITIPANLANAKDVVVLIQ